MSNSKPSSNKVKVSVAIEPEPDIIPVEAVPEVTPSEAEPPAEVMVAESAETVEGEPTDTDLTAETISVAEPSQPVPDAKAARSTTDIKRVRQPMKPPKAASSVSFWVWSAITICLAGGLLASGWPAAHWYAGKTASRLVGDAMTTSADQANLDYRVANILDPANPTAAWHIAASELADSHARGAADTLQRANGGRDAEFITTLIRAELETGDISAAVKNAHALEKIENLTDDQLITVAMAYGVAGEGSSVVALEPRISSPQALGRIRKVQAGNVSLADVLGASGLLNSSSAILMKLPSSAPRNLRLAKLDAASPTKSDWSAAAELYQSYLAAVPTDINARLAFAVVLDRLKQPDDANHQRNLVASLQAGRP